jgi:hypothetical protein
VSTDRLTKDDKIREEAAALWFATFGEAPSEDLDGSRMLEIVMQLQEPATYVRLSPAARARGLTWPKGAPLG